MAISNGQYTVSTKPIAIHSIDDDGVLVTVNTSHDVYLGDVNVTTKNGYLHSKDAPPLHLDLAPNEIIYAIRAGNHDAVVTTLRTKNT